MSNWKIIEELGIREYCGRNRPYVVAICPHCNQEKEIMYYHTRNKSCGCLKKESAIKRGQRQRTENGHINSLITRYKKSAKVRNIEWNLNFDDFSDIVKSNCFYCGKEPTLRKGKTQYGKVIPTNGVDRKINSVGYVKENCVPCCITCNKMKLDHDIENFKNHISKIYEHFR